MSISAAMYAAVTGLSALSTGMQVISNNIANVNTVGFKAGRTNFEDLISQDYWSNGKIQQIGRGVKVASVQQMFTQGSFMNSAQDTDMAITGEGFFQVRDRVTNELMYTRAGNFTFDANGLLETPAGYVLQGWELSIPKPGQEPVRIGMPVDVKVIALNAPPVETGQIKVVANLNADDSSAYVYSQSAWAGLYADQLADGPAELARQAAIEATYSYVPNGSAYPNSSKAFETAFENWMVANGYFESAGTIYKTISPSPSEITAAAKAASASAWTILAITGDAASPYYPITVGHVSGQAYAIAYNNAYHDYMIGQGFTEDPQGKFYIKTVTPLSSTSSAADLADQAGKLAAGGLPYSYPSGDPAKDTAYATAYSNFLTIYSSLIQKPADIHYSNPSTGEIGIAEGLGLAAAQVTSASYGGYPQASIEEDLAYLAAYTKELTDTAGTTYVLSYSNPMRLDMAADFASPAPIDSDIAIATPAALTAALAIDSNFASYPGTNEAANIAYVNALLFDSTNGLVSQGFSLNPSFTLPTSLPTVANFTKEPDSVDLIAANTSGITAAKNAGAASNYTYPMGEPAWDAAYLTEYDATLNARGYVQTVPAVTGFKIVNSQSPSTTDINNARDYAKSTAASVIGSNLGYPYPSTALLSVFQNTYNAEYVNQMTTVLGYVNNSGVFTKSQPATGTEIAAGQAAARTLAELEAKNAGQLAYDTEYQLLYQSAMASISGQFAPWQLEGNGFAGAWDGTDLSSPIDPENYTHANPWTIYDSLGTAHTLMVYYQPNPNMENVWDYIITCDPTEDARKDLNNRVVMNGATFAGIIQKGKITFTADGPDRHGGQVKDIEAQNIDMSKTAAAALTSAVPNSQNPATASSMNFAKLEGYFTGQPVFSASTGTMVDSPRQYSIKWEGNLGTVPDVSGFTWTDDAGNSGTIPIYDKNYTGPYPFGSGLNVSFTEGGKPMAFTVGDTLGFVAHSEEIGWTNLSPNTAGYFDFDVAFVQSASMALHPPYPEGLPTIIQHIALDMGARNPNGQNGSWILDEQGTTQYASKSINIFSSQDGYPAGSLQRVSIDKDGILTGIYTNGRHQPLYQIGLARFINPWGLAKLGDNVYMETRWSGVGTINPPGYGGTGTIRANFLEQSNTDLADEIVNMIVTQRGFQANSKVVTTTDTMLAEVIEMKR